jgi:hypothetical protein
MLRSRANLLGLSILAVAVLLAGCRSEGPPPGDVNAGYYPGKMAPNGRGRSDEGGGARPGSSAPRTGRGMGG